jgi:plastocyanin
MRPGGCRRRAALALLCGAWLSRTHAGATVEVTILDYKFDPAQLTVKVGATVRWVNAEKRVTHSVLFSGPGGYESERFFPGESWQRTFDKPGRYPYGCGPHPEMRGQIEVTP